MGFNVSYAERRKRVRGTGMSVQSIAFRGQNIENRMAASQNDGAIRFPGLFIWTIGALA